MINAEFRQITRGEKLAEGRYLIVDPCYVFGEPQELWNRICNELGSSRDPLVMAINNYDVFIFSTAYGDGCYPVSQDDEIIGEFGVDAGLFAFVPEQLIVEIGFKIIDLGVWVNITQEFAIDWQTTIGDVSVGGIYVETNWWIDDDDDDDDDDE